MKNILVFGATGRIGQKLLPLLSHHQVTAYVRDKNKMKDLKDIQIIEGDVLDLKQLTKSFENQDIVIAILSGDLLTYAKNIKEALNKSNVQRIIWITGMGIHHEVPGEVGKLLDKLCKEMPEYVQATDTIISSNTPYTLIRAAHLTDGDNAQYYIQHAGENLHSNSVDRIAVARLIADLIENNKGIVDSLGVTN